MGNGRHVFLRCCTAYRSLLHPLGVEGMTTLQRRLPSGVYLAGAWAATGWPATMDGAVRSGDAAAAVLLADARSVSTEAA